MNAVTCFASRARLTWQLWTHRQTAWWMPPVALLLAAVALTLFVLSPLRHDVAVLKARAAAAEARRTQPAAVTLSPATLEPQIDRLLPEEAPPTRLLERLFALAAQHDLQLRRGEYKAGQLQPIGVDSVQITLPLQGDYAQLRAWIADVLAEMPQASIERLALRRDDLVQRRLDADVMITLWRKSQGGRPTASNTSGPVHLAIVGSRP